MRKTLVFLVFVLVFALTSSVHADDTNAGTNTTQSIVEVYNQDMRIENRAQGLTVTASDVGLDQDAQYAAMPADAEMNQISTQEIIQEIQATSAVNNCTDKTRVLTSGSAGASQTSMQQQTGLAGNGYIGVQSGTSTQTSTSSVVSVSN
jgi:hypothetical protein